MILQIAFAVCIFGVVNASRRYCPVSSGYDLKSMYHGYPVSLFPDIHPQPATSFKCFLPNKDGIELCSRDTDLCPVTRETIDIATSIATWPQYTDAIERLGTQERINVFYLGGSMTRGAQTEGKCVCNHAEDMRCAHVASEFLHESSCSWTTHISKWLNHTFPATDFQFYDFSAGGHSSLTSDYFVSRVQKANANFTATSLFFLDFSVNDAQHRTGSGVEGMIRTIYANFGAHYSTKPTIVVIEQYPHAVFRPENHSPLNLNTEQDYAVNYRRIAQHYSTVHLSLREIFWGYYGDPAKRNIKDENSTHHWHFSPFETFIHVRAHAPWFVHLFMADVFAASILRLRDGVVPTLRTLPFDRPNSASITSALLPSPVYPDKLAAMTPPCDLARPFLVEAVARSTAHAPPNNHTKGWEEYLDVHDPGFIITNLSNPDMRILSFPLKVSEPLQAGATLEVSYLKSYEGMGTATVRLCGSALGATLLDGLWKERLSLPYSFTAIVSEADAKRCSKVPADRRNLDVVYAPGDDEKDLRSKHGNKFKVFTAHICQAFHM